MKYIIHAHFVGVLFDNTSLSVYDIIGYDDDGDDDDDNDEKYPLH